MIIEKSFIDIFLPNHDRTSCSDSDKCNKYGGFYNEYDSTNGQKIISYPRCRRCYLLDHVGCDSDSLEFNLKKCEREIPSTALAMG